MTTIVPEGEAIRRAIKWISYHLEENPKQPLADLVQKAVLHFDLSPKEAEFLIRFYLNSARERGTSLYHEDHDL